MNEKLEILQLIADDIAATRAELNELPNDISEGDKDRVSRLEHLIHEQLEGFAFRSYQAKRVNLDESSLRPQRGGFDLDSDVSSSDIVRIKIAYLNGIRELANDLSSPHPGILLLDEPRQHEMDASNFRATLSRLSASGQQGDQVIVTSAATASDLDELLGNAECNIVDLGDERVLQLRNSVDNIPLSGK